MDLGIRDQVALVAAASRGFGRSIAHGLAAEGCRVAICARQRGPLEQTADEIRAATGVEVLAHVADVTRADECRGFVDAARRRWGRVDILVTNSGGPRPGDFDAVNDADWQAAFDSTLLSVVRLIRPCLPLMRQAGGGRIVNVQSISIKQPVDGLLLSNSIRPGVAGLTRALGSRLGPDNILINTVCPGSHDTDRIRELLGARAAARGTRVADEEAKLAESIPLGRLGEPEELAAAVVFLCSARASYITGTCLLVDGGACRATT